jgi:hypothetical protein
MKLLPIALLSSAFAIGLSAAIPTLTITEQAETITADYNGTPVPVALTGPVDGWTIELPGSFQLNVGGPFVFGEPENATLRNEVFVNQPTFLIWGSDLPGGAGEPTSLTIPFGGVFTGGQTPETFQLVLQDLPETTTAPDSGTTIALLGGAATLMAGLRTKMRR